ncbi:uncharacterized protein [Littorina saxatilis]|uniref:Novel STAND NTPase 3 domain-containing protein n=1 Tax=Littorina saxatilis TaxID=31220 RepID=A0AAN9AXU8_9CAEN
MSSPGDDGAMEMTQEIETRNSRQISNIADVDTEAASSLLANRGIGQVNICDISAPVNFGAQEVHNATYVKNQTVERQVVNSITNVFNSCSTCPDRSPCVGNPIHTSPCSVKIQGVNEEDLAKAVELLEENGRVGLCGGVQSGKTALGNAILEHFKQKGFIPFRVEEVCCHLQQDVKGKSIVLIDGALGMIGLDRARYRRCQSLRRNSPCLIVVTLYPHVLREVREQEKILDNPFLPAALVISLNHCPRDLCAVHYVPLLQCMLDDACLGKPFAALLLRSLQEDDSLELDSPALEAELSRLVSTSVNLCDLKKLVYNLKGSVFSNSGLGFLSRVLYDAAGLTLGSMHFKANVLQVCDVAFFVQHVGTLGTSKETLILIDSTDREYRVVMQRMYKMIEDGQLSELCQHPSLSCRQFLADFQTFCRGQDDYVDLLVSAVDRGLPLLYWSAWSLSSCLFRWLMTVLRERIVASRALSEGFLCAAIIAVLFEEREICRELTLIPLLLPAQPRWNLLLPSPKRFLKQGINAQFDGLKKRLQSGALCYLDDHSLPIPATLLSVTVTEDPVNVELPSQHWYLALRLLADREVDETDLDGNTLLHIAADKGNLEAITLAVKSGASVNTKNKNGQTPCQLAQKNQPSTPWAMFSHFHLLKACKEGNLLAVLWGSRHEQADRSNGDTALHVASRSGQTQAASILTQLIANVNVKNKKGETPLHCAAKAGNTDVASVLILRGAAVDLKDGDGSTPLHTAAFNGCTEMVRLLLEKRGSVGRKDKCGATALHKACENGHTDTARLLLETGASVGMKDKFGATALHKVCENGHTDTARLLLEHRSRVNVKDRGGRTPLHKAIKSGYTDTVYFLLKAGASAVKKDIKGGTALHIACERGHTVIAKLLLEHKASVATKDVNGQTPLHKACSTGQTEAVLLLLTRQAVKAAKDKKRRTPADLAFKKGHKSLVNIIHNFAG